MFPQTPGSGSRFPPFVSSHRIRPYSPSLSPRPPQAPFFTLRQRHCHPIENGGSRPFLPLQPTSFFVPAPQTPRTQNTARSLIGMLEPCCGDGLLCPNSGVPALECLLPLESNLAVVVSGKGRGESLLKAVMRPSPVLTMLSSSHPAVPYSSNHRVRFISFGLPIPSV